MSEFNAQDVANTAWAFAMINRPGEKLFTVLAKAAKQRVSEFDAQGLANTAWALATVKLPDYFRKRSEASPEYFWNISRLFPDLWWMRTETGQTYECQDNPIISQYSHLDLEFGLLKKTIQ